MISIRITQLMPLALALYIFQAPDAISQSLPDRSLTENTIPARSETSAVTYIANEGFFIETQNHKILIDALFGPIEGNWCDQPADSIAQAMMNGLAPFDKIDLVLVTHRHSDHFSPSRVMSFLMNNHDAILICPEQVNTLLEADSSYQYVAARINCPVANEFIDEYFNISDIYVRAIKFDHGSYLVADSVSGETYNIHRDVENLGYIISADGFTFFHSGDDSPSNEQQYKRYGIDTNNFDIAFLDRVFLGKGGMDLVSKYIYSEKIVFMHIEPGRAEYYQSVIKNFPELIVFGSPMERLLITQNE